MFAFPGQLEGEKVLDVVRKHPIVYVRILVGFALTVFFPVLIFLSIWLGSSASDSAVNNAVVGIFVSLYLLYGLMLTCIAWINEAYDLLIVTNERIVDVTQVTLLKRTVSSTPLARVQDATGNVDGFFATLLNYGTLEIQTAAGDASTFNIDRVSDPNTLAQEILNWSKEKKETGRILAQEI